MRHPVILAMIGIIVALGVWIMRDEPTRVVLFQPSGAIDSGEAFGVTVGEPREQARAALGARFAHARSKQGGQCFVREFSEDHTLDVFSDRSWRRGSICVASRDGVVVSVLWFYNPLMP